jgi:hypothetical protein
MVKRVLWYLFIAIIVILIILWLLSGGIGKIKIAAKDFGHPLSNLESGASFMLPDQVPIPQGPDISVLTNSPAAKAQLQNEQQDQSQSQSQTFGNPSPYDNSFTLDASGAGGSTPQSQYVVIQNGGADTIDITGWSLQSALTGARSYIPRAASFFALGALNTQTDIELAPGASAIVTTGTSPVGTSFRENECSGYLGQLQNYDPPIERSCPSPSDSVDQAAQYGQACADFISSLSSCQFPTSVPSDVTTACQTYVQNNFSYNGCVQTHQSDSGFASNSWRVYLDASRLLWSGSHDTIRILDAKGEIVAVTSY